MDRKKTNIKERTLQVAKNKGISYELFFSELGLSYSNFKGKQKESSLNSDSIVRIITKHPEIDLYWFVTGIEQTPPKQVINEPAETYATTCNLCVEKEKRIKLLEIQNEELKQDKQDFKNLLGLKNDKTA